MRSLSSAQGAVPELQQGRTNHFAQAKGTRLIAARLLPIEWGVTLRHRIHKGARMWDRDVRFAVRDRLQREHRGDADTRIVEEMGIWNGAVRVDVAVINGELAAYELKSARDTLTRLPNQAALYSLVFDRVSLVAAERHLEAAEKEIPAWWGVISARVSNGSVVLAELRKSKRNPAQDPMQLARLLWKEEASALLETRDALTGYRSASRDQLARRLVEVFDHRTLADGVRRYLKDRPIWLGQVGTPPPRNAESKPTNVAPEPVCWKLKEPSKPIRCPPIAVVS